VTDVNFSEVYELFLEACRIFEVPEIPELFITYGDKEAMCRSGSMS
jgi:hypothetical protein